MKVTFSPRPLLQTCRLETTALFLNTSLIVNKKFFILIIFIEINVNVCLLCAHHVMASIILHTRKPTVNKYLLRNWFLCFS